MKRTNLFILSLLAPLASLLITACHGDVPTLDNQRDTISWALGESLADAVIENRIAIDTDIMVQAFVHTIKGGEQPIDETTYKAACQYIQAMAVRNMAEIRKEQSTKAKSDEEAYFAKLEKEHPEFIKTDNGVYCEQIRAGHGPNAKMGERVKFDYKGYFMLTGELFDQTYGHRDPIIHVLATPMSEGLLSGMLQMNEGSIYRLYIPNRLGWGADGNEVIPPYTPLIYEVELHEIFKD